LLPQAKTGLFLTLSDWILYEDNEKRVSFARAPDAPYGECARTHEGVGAAQA